MTRIALIAVFGLLFITVSCEKCKRCSYTYDEILIQQGVNGEEQVTVEHSGVLSTSDGTAAFGEECIKGDEQFTIEQFYQNKKDTTTLINFEFTCSDF
jgi:repressor of nif and glnA expression